MTTHEVEVNLGMSKQTLIYYENEGLVKPERDVNNYRQYSYENIDTLKFIQLLRSMDLSIDEIKRILNNQVSIRAVLETKKEFIKNSKIKLDNIDKKIKDYVKRKKVKVAFNNQQIKDWDKKETLFFNNESFNYNDIIFNHSSIISIDISMSSSIGFMHGLSVFFNYYLDINIHTKRDVYLFQVMNNDQVIEMFDYFKMNSIIYDPLNINQIYREKKDPVALNKYLDSHFRKWAKKYGLDNPRENYIYKK